MYGKFVAIDRGRDGIDQERHVVVDHFDERVCRRVAVVFFRRIVDADQRPAAATLAGELEMIECDASHDFFRTALHVLDRYVGKILCQVPPDMCLVLEDARLYGCSDNRVDDDLPDIPDPAVFIRCHCTCSNRARRPDR